MDDRTALLLAWLEGEGERQRRPVLPPPQANDPTLRAWVQVGVCTLGGALAAALFVCWLAAAWEKEKRVCCMERLRLYALLGMTGDPNRPSLTPERWEGEGVTARKYGGALGAFLCVMVFALPLGTVIGAVFLRAACALYNKQAGGKGLPDSVPEPLLGKAMGITFVTTLVNGIAGFVIGLLVGAGGAAAGSGERGPAVMAQLLSLPVSLLVMAGMNSALLPTTFSRGLSVALWYLLVVFFVVAVLAVICGGLFLAASLLL
jgi:hypothetical protein